MFWKGSGRTKRRGHGKWHKRKERGVVIEQGREFCHIFKYLGNKPYDIWGLIMMALQTSRENRD